MTHDEAYTAMCLWEAWLDMQSGTGPVSEEIARLQSEHGTATMREVVLKLAEDCEIAWDAASALGYDSPFDWEFCPDFLRVVIESGNIMNVFDTPVAPAPRMMVAGDL